MKKYIYVIFCLWIFINQKRIYNNLLYLTIYRIFVLTVNIFLWFKFFIICGS
jgi:hypothetical protein